MGFKDRLNVILEHFIFEDIGNKLRDKIAADVLKNLEQQGSDEPILRYLESDDPTSGDLKSLIISIKNHMMVAASAQDHKLQYYIDGIDVVDMIYLLWGKIYGGQDTYKALIKAAKVLPTKDKYQEYLGDSATEKLGYIHLLLLPSILARYEKELTKTPGTGMIGDKRSRHPASAVKGADLERIVGAELGEASGGRIYDTPQRTERLKAIAEWMKKDTKFRPAWKTKGNNTLSAYLIGLNNPKGFDFNDFLALYGNDISGKSERLIDLKNNKSLVNKMAWLIYGLALRSIDMFNITNPSASIAINRMQPIRLTMSPEEAQKQLKGAIDQFRKQNQGEL